MNIYYLFYGSKNSSGIIFFINDGKLRRQTGLAFCEVPKIVRLKPRINSSSLKVGNRILQLKVLTRLLKAKRRLTSLIHNYMNISYLDNLKSTNY